MAFQFYCPKHHLLEADEGHSGQQSQCPHCGSLFVIPVLPVPVLPASDVGPTQSPPPPQPQFPPGWPDTPPSFTGGSTNSKGLPPPRPNAVGHADPSQPANQSALPDSSPATGEPAAEVVLHIPCQGCGKDLETPLEMLGQEANCPYCQHQFRLRRKESREYIAAKELREAEFGRKALRWAIGAAVVVALGLVSMLVYSIVSRQPAAPHEPRETRNQ